MRAPLLRVLRGPGYRARQLVAGTNLVDGCRGDGTAVSSRPAPAACPTAAKATSSAATSRSSGFPRTTRTAGATPCSPCASTDSRPAEYPCAAGRFTPLGPDRLGAPTGSSCSPDSPALAADPFASPSARPQPVASAGLEPADAPGTAEAGSVAVPTGTGSASCRSPDAPPGSRAVGPVRTERLSVPVAPEPPCAPTGSLSSAGNSAAARTSVPADPIASPVPRRATRTAITSAGSRACAPERRRAWPATSPATGSGSPASGRARSRRRPVPAQPRSTGASARSCTL